MNVAPKTPTSQVPLHSEASWYEPDMPAIIAPRRPTPIRSLFAVLLILFAGSLLGITSAYLMIERDRPFLSVTIGPWSAYPEAGTSEADPYSVAIYTRSARIPLASGEGLAISARTDSSGATLNPACDYRISGQTPTARLWTLTAADNHGRLVPTLAGRTFLTSRQILRKEDGSFEITAARAPRPGNWLPLGLPRASETGADGMATAGGIGSGLMFTFRLYDAPITTGSALDGAVMPLIERLSCS
ncbi:DUF1214 domain-containing protein [Roseibium polysiphoniae]|uniref:DUF1214 domain-containing protein n=1 Tax=Roseibium polysiphoniae TaxID=2571221 RepID=A0ABR9C4Y1_9HYPH|nr:DUF1214 domain-containing protein [Roseibium polysiphoniae]MBD8874840.1 DUF1214 domain-containing protein [Roseibium polysiphoniae]